jgi:hypothetical protein
MKIIVPGIDVAVCRLDAAAELPRWGRDSRFYSLTRTEGELSVVCESRFVPVGVRAESGWSMLELEGPIPFEQPGVLLSILEPLARAGIAIFAVSTYDTDCVLVKAKRLEEALAALARAGFEVVRRAAPR